jgi:hypothetical protein
MTAKGLDPGELHAVFDRIDEFLAFHQMIHTEGHLTVDEKIVSIGSPQLDRLVELSDWLKMSSAPLRQSEGIGGLRGFFFRLLNLPVRIFGAGQIAYNRKTREFIHELMIVLEAFNAQNHTFSIVLADMKRNQEACTDLTNKISALEASIARYQEELREMNQTMLAVRQELDTVSSSIFGDYRP